MEKNCITQINTPSIDNTQIECDEIISSKCVVVGEQCNKVGNLEGENLEQYLGRLCTKLTTMDDKIGILIEDAETVEPNGNSYFTTETLTGGTWIDGKPIYRIVFTDLADTGNILIEHNLSIDEHIRAEMIFYQEGSRYKREISNDVYNEYGSGYEAFRLTELMSNSLGITFNEGAEPKPRSGKRIILEYTKTTVQI